MNTFAIDYHTGIFRDFSDCFYTRTIDKPVFVHKSVDIINILKRSFY